MSETKQQEATTGTTPELEVKTSTDAPAVDGSERTEQGRRGQGGDKRNQRRPRRGASRPERVRPEFDQ